MGETTIFTCCPRKVDRATENSKGSTESVFGWLFYGVGRVHGVLMMMQFGFAGHQVLSKVALTSGLSQFVFAIYRNSIALLLMTPIAYFMEKKERPALTVGMLMKFFLLGITGILGSQQLFLAGLMYTSATFAATMQNAVPVITFFMATLLGLEKVRFDRKDGKAKVLGTFVCVFGAVLMSVYKGPAVIQGWFVDVGNGTDVTAIVGPMLGAHFFKAGIGKWQIGGFLLLVNCVCWSGYLIMQAPILREYPAPFTITAFTYLFGSIQVYVVMLIFNGGHVNFALKWGTQAVSVVYAGVISSGINFSLQSWCIQRSGPLLVSLYTPVQTIVVAILSIIILGDSLFLGSIIGGCGAIIGLYLVTWGQMEHKRQDNLDNENGVDVESLHNQSLTQPLLQESHVGQKT